MYLNFFNNLRRIVDRWELLPIQYDRDDPKNYTGRVILPQAVLEDLVALNVPSPYLFQITNTETRMSIFCGVLEFTGADGIVLVPIWLFQQLGLEYAKIIFLKVREFANGTFLKLLPHDVEFLEIESHKLELERSLRDYQVLSTGDEIVLNIRDHGPMRFTVSEIQPEGDAIYIVDTDLTVDFLPPIGYEEKLEKEKSLLPFIEIVSTEGEDIKCINMSVPGIFYDWHVFE